MRTTVAMKLKFLGIQEFLEDTKGKDLIYEIQEKHHCIIRLKSENSKTIKLKDSEADEVYIYGSVSLKIKQGDITKETVDVIVNSIQDSMDLSHYGQVSKVLFQTCGQELQDECNNKKSEMAQNGVVLTSAPNLSCKHIIHISQFQFQQCLDVGVTKILYEAEKIGASSLAMPVLRAGSKYASLNDIKTNILGAIEKFGTSEKRKLNKIHLVIFDPEVLKFFLDTEKNSPCASSSRNPQIDISQVSKVKIYSNNTDNREAAEKELKEKCQAAFKSQLEQYKSLKLLKKDQIKEIEQLALQNGVKITFMNEEYLMMEGFKIDRIFKVTQELKNRLVEVDQQQSKSSKRNKWVKQENNWQNFDSKLNREIDRQYKRSHNSSTIETVDAKIRKIDEIIVGKSFSDILRVDKTQVHENFPKKWDVMSERENLKLVTLQPGTSEYKKVEQHFFLKGAVEIIKKIDRIQNKSLYQLFSVKKRHLYLQNPKEHQKEMKLFHGTSASAVPQINENGFNRNYCGVNGTNYGNGVYFALHSSYSVRYAEPDSQGDRHVYQARVLVGENVKTDSTTKFLPNKPETNSPYDSGGNGKGIYVIFHDAQVYPEYIITF